MGRLRNILLGYKEGEEETYPMQSQEEFKKTYTEYMKKGEQEDYNRKVKEIKEEIQRTPAYKYTKKVYDVVGKGYLQPAYEQAKKDVNKAVDWKTLQLRKKQEQARARYEALKRYQKTKKRKQAPRKRVVYVKQAPQPMQPILPIYSYGNRYSSLKSPNYQEVSQFGRYTVPYRPVGVQQSFLQYKPVGRKK